MVRYYHIGLLILYIYSRNEAVDAKLPLFPFAVEVYVISDYSHTEGLRKMSLKPFEYMKTYMYKVSLQLQQLEPPILIALVGYNTTSQKYADYVSFTDAGDLDADGTVIKLRHYAGNSTSAQQSDLVILFTQSQIVDVSANVGAPEMLGIAPFEGICSEYSVAVVKDEAGWYTGVHSMVHEMGHLFGSYHDGDNTSVSCPAELGYIMSPTSHGKHKDHFSTCSKAAIAKYVRSDAGGCLRSAASQRPIGINPWRYKRSRRRKRPDHDVTTAF
nr:venom metalloproteinase 3-like isoform X2 [Rhipicephalus microplus]